MIGLVEYKGTKVADMMIGNDGEYHKMEDLP
jgi:hypothetical protein